MNEIFDRENMEQVENAAAVAVEDAQDSAGLEQGEITTEE